MLLIALKDIFRLTINCVYGKTIKNLQKKINVKLVNNEKYYLKHVSKPNFVSEKILDQKSASSHEITLKTANLCWVYCSWIN